LPGDAVTAELGAETASDERDDAGWVAGNAAGMPAADAASGQGKAAGTGACGRL
jgi:hypothetical protein